MDEGSGEVPQISPTEASLNFVDTYSFRALDHFPTLTPILSHPSVRIVAQSLYTGRNLEAVVAAAVIAKDALKTWITPSK